MPITEQQIIDAAKALLSEQWGGVDCWDLAYTETKWRYMWKAYAALRAARKVRGL